MPLATTNILPTSVMKEASELAFSAGMYLSPGTDYQEWNTAGSGETFNIPYFPVTTPAFQADGNAATNPSYTPTARPITLRKVQKNPVYILDQDASIHGDYLAKKVGEQIGLDSAQYMCNIIVHGVAALAVAASQATEITGAAGATATETNIQDAFWQLLEDCKVQGINLSGSYLVCRPRVAVVIRKLAALSSADYSKNADSTSNGYFDLFKGPGGLKVISPINLWFGTDKSADTNLPNDVVVNGHPSARINYTNYWGVVIQSDKLHVGVTERFRIEQGREDEKFHNLYTGRSIWGYNLSDLAGARALMNASA